MGVSDKIMFEIYREADFARKYRVVYFTELEDHNKELEISRAMAGDHLFDGFFGDRQKVQGKQAVTGLLSRLNGGETLNEQQVEQVLEPYMAE